MISPKKMQLEEFKTFGKCHLERGPTLLVMSTSSKSIDFREKISPWNASQIKILDTKKSKKMRMKSWWYESFAGVTRDDCGEKGRGANYEGISYQYHQMYFLSIFPNIFLSNLINGFFLFFLFFCQSYFKHLVILEFNWVRTIFCTFPCHQISGISRRRRKQQRVVLTLFLFCHHKISKQVKD